MAEACALERYAVRAQEVDTTPLSGEVVRAVGLLVESRGPAASVGEVCEVRSSGGHTLPLEVVGFRDGRLLSVPLGDTAGIRPGQRVVLRGSSVLVPAGAALLGRVIDGLGRPLDGKGPLATTESAPLRPPNTPMR